MKKELLFTRKQGRIQTEEQEMKKIKCEVMSSFYSPTNFTSKTTYPSLTTLEKQKIEEVVSYYKIFKEDTVVGDYKMLDELGMDECLDFFEEYGKIAIRTVKNIPTVKCYSMEDKLIMMRNFMGVFNDVRFAYFYDVESRSGMMQNFRKENSFVRLSIDAWDEYFPEELKNTWMRIVQKNKFAMMNDPIIRDLLITIGLFLEHEKISCPQVLRNHYLEYYYLLRRYLQVKLKSREKFEKHMRLFHNVLGGYPEINDLNKEFFQSIWPHYSSELFSEIYYIE